jgi:hypothetical protein
MSAVLAGELHIGDIWHEHDWRLHVRRVDVDAAGNSVAIVVDEFPKDVQHRAADAVLNVEVAS